MQLEIPAVSHFHKIARIDKAAHHLGSFYEGVPLFDGYLILPLHGGAGSLKGLCVPRMTEGHQDCSYQCES
jgi:hypothetical protein